MTKTFGIKQVADNIWLVSSIDYGLGYFDDETCRLEPIDNPFGRRSGPKAALNRVARQ